MTATDLPFLSAEDMAALSALLDAQPTDPKLAFVTFARALGKNLETDFRCADLRGYPLMGQDLTGVNLNGADLRGADLRDAVGYRRNGVLLEGAILSAGETASADHPKMRNSRAVMLDGLGRHAEALAEYDTVLAVEMYDPGPEARETLTIRHNRAVALGNLDRHAEALAEYDTVLALEMYDPGPEALDTLTPRYNRAMALDSLGRYAEALAEYDAVLAVEMRVLGPEAEDTLMTVSARAVTVATLGDKAVAIGDLRRCIAIFPARGKLDRVARAQLRLARILADTGEVEEALDLARQVIGDLSSRKAETHAVLVGARELVARLGGAAGHGA